MRQLLVVGEHCRFFVKRQTFEQLFKPNISQDIPWNVFPILEAVFSRSNASTLKKVHAWAIFPGTTSLVSFIEINDLHMGYVPSEDAGTNSEFSFVLETRSSRSYLNEIETNDRDVYERLKMVKARGKSRLRGSNLARNWLLLTFEQIQRVAGSSRWPTSYVSTGWITNLSGIATSRDRRV